MTQYVSTDTSRGILECGPPSAEERYSERYRRQISELLNRVADGESPLGILRAYLPGDVALEQSRRVRSHRLLSAYERAPEIKKLGSPYYDAVRTAKTEAEYWCTASQAISQIRAMFAPQLAPIDSIRLDLQDFGRQDVNPLRNALGQVAFAGLARVFDSAGTLPHCDRLDWDAPRERFRGTPTSQVAANVYLEVPEVGGEIEIWDLVPSFEEHEGLSIANSYGLDRRKLGPPAWVVKPRTGDVVFFDARCVHAVRPSTHGLRVTSSAFLVQFSKHGAFYIYS